MTRLAAILALAMTIAAGSSGCGVVDSTGIETAPICTDGHGYGLVVLDSCAAAPGCATCARESASGSRAPLGEACTPPAAYGANVLCVESCDACPAVVQ